MVFVDFVTAFGIIFFAEIGDKTQVMSMSLQTKYKHKMLVISGVICGLFLMMVINLLIALIIKSFLDKQMIDFISGIILLLFALLILREARKNNSESHLENENFNNTQDINLNNLYIFLNVIFIIMLAEFGDGSQILFISLVSHQNDLLLTFIGGTLAMIIVDIFGVLLADILDRYISQTVFHFIVFVLFLVYGGLLLISAFMT